MADMIHFDVKGIREVGLRFEQFPAELHDQIKAEIDALSKQLFAMVNAATPSKTGRLRSQEWLKLFDDGDSIKGAVYIAGQGSGKNSDFAKAGALEYGAHMPFEVAAHAMKLDHAWANQLANPLTVQVKSHPRKPNVPEFAFERGPLAAMQPEIIERLNAVVAKAAAQANAGGA